MWNSIVSIPDHCIFIKSTVLKKFTNTSLEIVKIHVIGSERNSIIYISENSKVIAPS